MQILSKLHKLNNQYPHLDKMFLIHWDIGDGDESISQLGYMSWYVLVISPAALL